jgi:hypothetical protein
VLKHAVQDPPDPERRLDHRRDERAPRQPLGLALDLDHGARDGHRGAVDDDLAGLAGVEVGLLR